MHSKQQSILPEQVNQFVSDHLPSDPDAWCKKYRDRKIIHDALWGTFQLQPYEVALLDTLLLQRLRFLHQTGAVYLTYASAHHTRFEHTLGVLHQSGRLCDALKPSDPGAHRVNQTFVDNVRFAAMLHDTGHGPFSHTSEQFYASHDDMSQFWAENPKLRNRGAGEILSYLIATSASCRAFVDKLNSHYGLQLDCDLIGQIITGTTPANLIYMSEIVHGPFDADKLDYMPRDGMFSGLKMHVDLDRLYHSIRILTANFEGVQQTRIAGHVSGLSPLTQIMFNKVLLYTGMYHHHKVRAVDCMLWAIFQLAREKNATFSGNALSTPADFLRLTDDRLLIPELCSDTEIQGLINDIRARRLWKKALVIARNTLPPAMHSESGPIPNAAYSGVTNLAGDEKELVEARREIARDIWERAKRPCKQHEVWLDVPKIQGMTEAKRMWIVAPGSPTPQTLVNFIPVDEWVALYRTHQARAHVFAPPHVCGAIGQAAIEVFKDRYGLDFLAEATNFAKS